MIINMDPQRHIYALAVIITGHHMSQRFVRVELREKLLAMNSLSDDLCSRQI